MRQNLRVRALAGTTYAAGGRSSRCAKGQTTGAAQVVSARALSLAEPESRAPAGGVPGSVSGERLPQLEDLPDVAGRRVLVRCDFNVPVRRGRVVNDQRIRAATPTLEWLVRRGATVTVATHLGRPGGRVDPRLSLDPVRRVLEELIPQAELLENLRFSAGEEANDPAFVDALTRDQDLFVNDAFATAHREHASVTGPPSRLPSAAGRLLSREVEVLTALRGRPRRPLVAVIGGDPRPDLMETIKTLTRFVDTVLLGGPVAFAAMDALAVLAGESRRHPPARLLPDQPAAWAELIGSGRVVLPVDVVTAADAAPGELRTYVSVPSGSRAVDLGHRTSMRFGQILGRAGTVFWDGLMGRPGDDRFCAGTAAVAEALVTSPAFTVISGSDTVDAVGRMGLSTYMDHVSTGGTASLQLLRDGDLPGIRALREAATH